jgi:AraC-like DNA-binding protein
MLFLADDINVQLLSVSRFHWDSGTYEVAPRPFCALACRIRGNGCFTNGDKMVRASAGDVIFMPQNFAYRAVYTPGKILAVHFLSDGAGCEMENFTPANFQMLYALFLKLHQIWNIRGAGCGFEAKACFYEILAELQKQSVAKEKRTGNQTFFQAVSFLENNFKNPELNISSVCDAAGISDTNFRRRFQKTFGKRPKDYLLELRLGCAEQLLAQRCYTVEEAANLCGFSDAKYFSRVIKKRYGCPPSKLFLPQ